MELRQMVSAVLSCKSDAEFFQMSFIVPTFALSAVSFLSDMRRGAFRFPVLANSSHQHRDNRELAAPPKQLQDGPQKKLIFGGRVASLISFSQNLTGSAVLLKRIK